MTELGNIFVADDKKGETAIEVTRSYYEVNY